MRSNPSVALAAVRSKTVRGAVVVDSLLFIVARIVCGGSVFVLL